MLGFHVSWTGNWLDCSIPWLHIKIELEVSKGRGDIRRGRDLCASSRISMRPYNSVFPGPIYPGMVPCYSRP